ncbi:thioredoxin family protein [Chloroflexota bacterium]
MRIARYISALVMMVLLFLLAISCQTSNSVTEQLDTVSSSEYDTVSTPLESALNSGLPTLAEFGRGVCIPCKAMKPILEEVSVEYQGKLIVVIVEIDDYMDETRQFGIMAIPTQIFFDSTGKEITRHMGFLSKEEIINQLGNMGIE